MKKSIFYLLVILLSTSMALHATDISSELTKDFVKGNPGIESIHSMSFGPEGILFLGDSERAKIFALDTKDTEQVEREEGYDMKQVDIKIAAALGTSSDNIQIQDMAVNPLSQMIYLAIHLEDGSPILLKTDGKALSAISLDNVYYSEVDLKNSIAEDAVDRRGRSQRRWAISDLAYHSGKVMVSGLSNEEFSSTFRSIPFPFSEEQSYSSLEIYHAAHGKYETHSPIKTFMPYELNGKLHAVASYTCTPLVIFPIDEMKAGEHSKGKTVAELGNRNTPLDIISYKKGDKSYLLLANTSRALMKIDPEKIEKYSDYLTEPVEENSATAGVEFIALPYVNVVQMDKLSDTRVVLLQRMANGELNLRTANSNRL